MKFSQDYPRAMREVLFEPVKPNYVHHLSKIFSSAIQEAGDISIFVWESLTWITRPPYRFGLLLESVEFIGFQSLFIIVLSALSTGMVFGLQTYFGFKIINAENLVGSTVAYGLAKEICPVMCGLLVTGRAGAATAAELGTMRVTEQIDAMEVMAVNPKQYLALPRILGATISLPLLSAIFLMIANFGSYALCVWSLKIDGAIFLNKIAWYVDPWDIGQGLIKSTVFGFILGSIATYKGFHCGHGAEGVGRATTETVVLSSVLILIVDFFLTSFLPVNI